MHSSPTCPNHLLDFDTRDIDFFCKFPDSLVGVFIGEWININLHPWSHCIKVRERVRQTDANGTTDSWHQGKEKPGCVGFLPQQVA